MTVLVDIYMQLCHVVWVSDDNEHDMFSNKARFIDIEFTRAPWHQQGRCSPFSLTRKLGECSEIPREDLGPQPERF